MNVLEVHDLTVRFGRGPSTAPAVDGVSFDVAEGTTLGLVGESGCGKSVTSRAVMRLLPSGGLVERGTVRLAGRDLSQLSEAQLRSVRGKDIAMVFQDPTSSLNPVLTIGEQVTETIRAHEHASRTAARARATELLGDVGIPDPRNALRRYPHQLSGGMRQRVAIASALSLRPRVLIADEPTTALDVTVQAQVLDLMKRLTHESGTALVFITHDLGVVARMADEVAVMYAGTIVEHATVGELFARARHPYTAMLLRSVPRVDVRHPGAAPTGRGPAPRQRRPTHGCPFAPRCPRRVDVCLSHPPALVPHGSGHRLACHNPEDA